MVAPSTCLYLGPRSLETPRYTQGASAATRLLSHAIRKLRFLPVAASASNEVVPSRVLCFFRVSESRQGITSGQLWTRPRDVPGMWACSSHKDDPRDLGHPFSLHSTPVKDRCSDGCNFPGKAPNKASNAAGNWKRFTSQQSLGVAAPRLDHGNPSHVFEDLPN